MTEAFFFYELESAGLGFEFLDDVRRVFDALREYPKLGQSIGRGILIVAVAHQKRRPGYWAKLIGS